MDDGDGNDDDSNTNCKMSKYSSCFYSPLIGGNTELGKQI